MRGYVQKLVDEARRAREEAEKEGAEPAGEARGSGRLAAQPRLGYKETANRRKGATQTTTRRRVAVAAVTSTRVGTRMWWWMEGGDGWDATGPSSVRNGWRHDPG